MGGCICTSSNHFFPLLENVKVTCPPRKNKRATKLEIVVSDEVTSQLRSTQQSFEVGFSIISEV